MACLRKEHTGRIRPCFKQNIQPIHDLLEESHRCTDVFPLGLRAQGSFLCSRVESNNPEKTICYAQGNDWLQFTNKAFVPKVRLYDKLAFGHGSCTNRYFPWVERPATWTKSGERSEVFSNIALRIRGHKG